MNLKNEKEYIDRVFETKNNILKAEAALKEKYGEDNISLSTKDNNTVHVQISLNESLSPDELVVIKETILNICGRDMVNVLFG